MHVGLTYTLKSSADNAANDDSQEEFDSPQTVEAIELVLQSLGHKIDRLGDGHELVRALLDSRHPDIIFNFAEGRAQTRSREAHAPALFEMFGIPFVGSDPLTLAVTLDKPVAKILVAERGVAVPQSLVVLPGQPIREIPNNWLNSTASLIVKPACEGSSKGIFDKSVFPDLNSALTAATKLTTIYSLPILIENYISGREITVGVVGNSPPNVIGILEITPKAATETFIYSLEAKRSWHERLDYHPQPLLSSTQRRNIEHAVGLCWQALGCRDFARFDFRLAGDTPYFLECNPIPGLSPTTSDLVILAQGNGIDYPKLIKMIFESALIRYGFFA